MPSRRFSKVEITSPPRAARFAAADEGGWRAEAIDQPAPALRLIGPAAAAPVERVERELPAASLDRRQRSHITDIVVATTRRSFIVAFETLPELWEVSFDPAALPVYDGMIHDWRMLEAIGVPGFLHPRRIPLPPETFPPIERLSKPHGGWVLAALRAKPAAGSEARCSHVALIHLDARRIVAQWRFAGAADVAAARVVLEDGGGAAALFALELRRDDGRELVQMIAAPRGPTHVESDLGCE